MLQLLTPSSITLHFFHCDLLLNKSPVSLYQWNFQTAGQEQVICTMTEIADRWMKQNIYPAGATSHTE